MNQGEEWKGEGRRERAKEEEMRGDLGELGADHTLSP